MAIEHDKLEWQKFAWLGAVIINCFSKRKVKPQDLIPGAFEDEDRIPMTKEAKNKMLDELKRELKVD